MILIQKSRFVFVSAPLSAFFFLRSGNNGEVKVGVHHGAGMFAPPSRRTVERNTGRLRVAPRTSHFGVVGLSLTRPRGQCQSTPFLDKCSQRFRQSLINVVARALLVAQDPLSLSVSCFLILVSYYYTTILNQDRKTSTGYYCGAKVPTR